MDELDGEILTFSLKTDKKLVVKHFIQKPILLNFLNLLSRIVCLKKSKISAKEYVRSVSLQ